MGPSLVSDTQTADPRELIDEVAQTLESVFAPLELLRARVESLFAQADEDGRPPASSDLAALDAAICSRLGGADGLVVGSGYIAAPSVLSDQEMWLQWWSGDGTTEPSRLVVDLDPSSDRYCDYTGLPWFSVPRDRGRRHITGPYVDYLCSDEYALTFTVPVTSAGRFVGVVGSDVYIRLFEPVMLPRLRALGDPAALVNAQGRIAVSTSVRQPVGSLVRHPDVAALWAADSPTVTDGDVTFCRCGDFPMALLNGAGLSG